MMDIKKRIKQYILDDIATLGIGKEGIERMLISWRIYEFCLSEDYERVTMESDNVTVEEIVSTVKDKEMQVFENFCKIIKVIRKH